MSLTEFYKSSVYYHQLTGWEVDTIFFELTEMQQFSGEGADAKVENTQRHL